MLDKSTTPTIAALPCADRPTRNATTVTTTCPYCGVGCGVLATPDGAGGPKRGRATPSRQFRQAVLQRLGARRNAGAHGAAAASDAARSTGTVQARGVGRCAGHDGAKIRGDHRAGRPQRRRGLSFRSIAHRRLLCRQQVDEGIIGSSNVDTNSRLCMASTVAGQRRAFGSDTARLLRRPRHGGFNRSRRLQRGMVPPDPLSAHAAQRAGAQPTRSWSSIRARPRPARRRICSSRVSPTGMDQALFSGLMVHLASSRRAR